MIADVPWILIRISSCIRSVTADTGTERQDFQRTVWVNIIIFDGLKCFTGTTGIGDGSRHYLSITSIVILYGGISSSPPSLSAFELEGPFFGI